jgi:hypothetical protein
VKYGGAEADPAAAMARPLGRRSGQERAADIKPFAAFLEKGAHGVPHVVVEYYSTPRGIGEVELLAIAKHSLELDETGDQLRLNIYGSKASGTDKAGGRGADALDRLGTE